MRRTIIALHSAVAPTAAVEALARSIDWERRSLFSLSGYHGNRQFIGQMLESTFRIHRRRYWRNDFVPHFYGAIRPGSNGGSRVEGHFDVSPWVKTFMRIWLVGVLLLAGPIFVLSLLDILAGTHFISGDAWVGIIVPPAMIIFGILLPKLGRLFAGGDEGYILQHLQSTLAAQVEKLELTRI